MSPVEPDGENEVCRNSYAPGHFAVASACSLGGMSRALAPAGSCTMHCPMRVIHEPGRQPRSQPHLHGQHQIEIMRSRSEGRFEGLQGCWGTGSVDHTSKPAEAQTAGGRKGGTWRLVSAHDPVRRVRSENIDRLRDLLGICSDPRCASDRNGPGHAQQTRWSSGVAFVCIPAIRASDVCDD